MATTRLVCSTAGPKHPREGPMAVERIEISRIRRDGGTQQRAGTDKHVVRRYAAAIRAGDPFPPVRLVFDGADYWLWDGFHRMEAHEVAGLTDILADVMVGTRQDAVWASFSANADHGLARTPADVRRILYRIFSDPMWKTKSQRDIAEHTKIGKSRVYEVLKEFRQRTGQEGPRAGPEPINKRRPHHPTRTRPGPGGRPADRGRRGVPDHPRVGATHWAPR
jgi:hypothetical protein